MVLTVSLNYKLLLFLCLCIVLKNIVEYQILQQMAMVRGQLKNAKWKKDLRSGSTKLRKLERQLKKIR